VLRPADAAQRADPPSLRRLTGASQDIARVDKQRATHWIPLPWRWKRLGEGTPVARTKQC
jgi:hypothetical protein